MKNEFSLTTFGSFEIFYNNKPLAKKSIHYKLMWEILLFLISNHGKSFYPEIVLESISPEKEYNDPAAVMRNQFYLLRKAFDSQDWVQLLSKNLLYSSGRYKWDTNLDFTCDAFEFEALINQGKLITNVDPEAAISYYRQALQLYKNYYLVDLTDKDWVIPFRAHFHDLYLSAILSITRLFKAKTDYKSMYEICEEALKIDYFDEGVHIGLMESLIARGYNARAREHYNEVTATFYNEMGIKPSSAMKNLYRISNFDSGIFEYDPAVISANLKNMLIRSEGAYLVDSEIFQYIIKFELLRGSRTDKSLYSCLLSLVKNDPGSTEREKLLDEMNNLQFVTLNSLRKGDVLTRWNETQFFLLLPDLERYRVNLVVERIVKTYQKLYPQSSLELTFKIAEVNPFTGAYVRETGQLEQVQISNLLKPEIDEKTIIKWQNNLNLVAESLDVQSCLIMKINQDNMEILLKNNNRDNPYEIGCKEKLGKGLYCETVIGTGEELYIPDARADELWKDNPDIELMMTSYYGLPLYWPDSTVFGTVCILDQEAIKLSGNTQALIRSVRDAIETDLCLLYERNQLKNIFNKDFLTNIYNRRALTEIINRELIRAHRTKQKLSVVMMDIDNFKLINDLHGHQAGDEVLQTFATAVVSNVRESDCFGRWGGDEFLLVCPDTDSAGVVMLIRKLARAINSIDLFKTYSMQYSIGWTESLDSDKSINEFIHRADQAMYCQKRMKNISK